MAGTQAEVRAKLSDHFSDADIGNMCCLGRCHENAAFHIGGENYSGEAIHQLKDVIAGSSSLETDTYPISSMGGAEILTAEDPAPELLSEAVERALAKQNVIHEIKESGLRGRGGAGFPMHIKLQAVAHEKDDEKYIVCNADEGDPGAYTDRYLLEKRPALVLFGMWAAAQAAGARDAILYIRGEYPEAIRKIADSISELDSVIGESSRFPVAFHIVKGRGAYICGEETALLASIEGQRAEVRIRPPFPAQSGLFGKPTLVNNVETFASLYWILEHGGVAYSKIGTDKSTGTKLMSLDSGFHHPGVIEVDMGTKLSTVFSHAGGFRVDAKAVQIGGPLGGIVPVDNVHELDVSFESFSNAGFLLGHASVVTIPESMPIREYIQHLFAFVSHESCGKCFPCRLGSKRGEEMFAAAADGRKISRELLNDLLETLEIGSLCGLGGGIPLPIRNAVQYFDNELKNFMDS
jgi:NADH-quinone oxidoreductase subunit F